MVDTAVLCKVEFCDIMIGVSGPVAQLVRARAS